MTVQLQPLGRSVVLVLDKDLLAEHDVPAGTRFSLEIGKNDLKLHRLPDEPGPDPVCTFEMAQAWVMSRFAPAFRVLAR